MKAKLSLFRGGVGTVVLAVAFTAAPVSGASAPSRDDSPGKRPYHCTTRTGGGDFNYPGAAASTTYDKWFGRGPHVPHLRTHIPQGLAYWPKKGWFLLTATSDGDDQARIIAIKRKSGKHVGTVQIAAGHVGGIAVARGFAYVADTTGDDAVRRYRLSKLAKKIHKPGKPFLRKKSIKAVDAASFVAIHDGKLWVGKFNEDNYARMYSYHLRRHGSIGRKTGRVSIPRKTQGLVVTDKYFFFSTSFDRNNRSNLYVQRRSNRKVRCFRAPSMSEGIAKAGKRMFVAYESGASEYANDGDKPDNIIKRLHQAPIGKLKNLELNS